MVKASSRGGEDPRGEWAGRRRMAARPNFVTRTVGWKSGVGLQRQAVHRR
jgi:hypothetical protein